MSFAINSVQKAKTNSPKSKYSFRSLNLFLIHTISRSRGVDFGIPALIPSDLPLFGSEFSNPPDPILGEVHAEFSWVQCMLTQTVVTFGSYILGTSPRCLLLVQASIGTLPVVSLMSWIILLNGLESKTVPQSSLTWHLQCMVSSGSIWML